MRGMRWEQQTCPECHTLLPIHVDVADCLTCEFDRREEALTDRHCRCAHPVPLRCYLGTFACALCSSLILPERVV